eukprot:TRINITY_DN7970_c0_g1_i1.p2 TRINITY_DN7970_c0_g1~~TRINITY_DN7970_c0_g1_i1.p2  ORF type:complete len:229 (+),score=-26.63 TRINITY_DN7970_c0_g1_i1:468-1154(+)
MHFKKQGYIQFEALQSNSNLYIQIIYILIYSILYIYLIPCMQLYEDVEIKTYNYCTFLLQRPPTFKLQISQTKNVLLISPRVFIQDSILLKDSFKFFQKIQIQIIISFYYPFSKMYWSASRKIQYLYIGCKQRFQCGYYTLKFMASYQIFIQMDENFWMGYIFISFFFLGENCQRILTSFRRPRTKSRNTRIFTCLMHSPNISTSQSNKNKIKIDQLQFTRDIQIVYT